MRNIMVMLSSMHVTEQDRSVYAQMSFVNPDDPIVRAAGEPRFVHAGITISDPCDMGFVEVAAFAAHHLVEASKTYQLKPARKDAASKVPTSLYVSLLSLRAGVLSAKVPGFAQLAGPDGSTVHFLMAAEEPEFEGQVIAALSTDPRDTQHPLWRTLRQATDLLLADASN